MIEFRRVSKVYPSGSTALRNVTFKINDGEFVFIIGRSGAGKSTLIKLLTCEERPNSGQVLIDQFDVGRIRRSLVPYLRRNIGMVFQDFRLINTKTVFENVAFAMEIVGSSPRLIRRRVPIVLSIVGLRDKASARPGELSGGEQQRVAIARAMVNNPKLILADEPTGNLDPTNSEAVMALLEEINRSGTTVIICTHDHSLVDRMKKRVVEIDDGNMVRDDCSGSYVSANSACASPAVGSLAQSALSGELRRSDDDEYPAGPASSSALPAGPPAGSAPRNDRRGQPALTASGSRAQAVPPTNDRTAPSSSQPVSFKLPRRAPPSPPAVPASPPKSAGGPGPARDPWGKPAPKPTRPENKP